MLTFRVILLYSSLASLALIFSRRATSSGFYSTMETSKCIWGHLQISKSLLPNNGRGDADVGLHGQITAGALICTATHSSYTHSRTAHFAAGCFHLLWEVSPTQAGATSRPPGAHAGRKDALRSPTISETLLGVLTRDSVSLLLTFLLQVLFQFPCCAEGQCGRFWFSKALLQFIPQPRRKRRVCLF